MFEINFRGILELLIVSVILIILMGITIMIMVPPVTAAELTYFQSGLHNDPLALRVSQGDTIYLGKTYDLSGVTGPSLQYAWWADWKQENYDCSPTKIIDIRYFKTRINKTTVYLNPDQWAPGNWFYWDDYECGLSYYDYSLGTTVSRNMPLQHDNKLAFTIIRPKPATIPPLNRITIFSPIAGYSSAYGEL